MAVAAPSAAAQHPGKLPKPHIISEERQTKRGKREGILHLRGLLSPFRFPPPGEIGQQLNAPLFLRGPLLPYSHPRGDVMGAPSPAALQTLLGTHSLSYMNLCVYLVSTTAPLGFTSLLQHTNEPQVTESLLLCLGSTVVVSCCSQQLCHIQVAEHTTPAGSSHTTLVEQQVTEAEE